MQWTWVVLLALVIHYPPILPFQKRRLHLLIPTTNETFPPKTWKKETLLHET